jgi:glycoprotein endo-alpha-1,2-mannosidase
MSRNKSQITFIVVFCLLALVLGCSAPSPPLPPAKPSPFSKVLVGAFYYLWYPGNWREGYVNGLVKPPQPPVLDEYDSSDPKAIERHIAWSSQYGIHFWAVSWWPGHPELDQILREKILKAQNIGDIKFCIFYETSGLGLAEDRITFNPEKTSKLVSDFRYLARTYFTHPSYLKVNGRPVVIIYLTRTFSGNYPEAISLIRESLKQLGFDLFLIGDEIFWYVIRSAPLPPSTHPNIARIKLFDAITAYNLYNWSKPAQMGYGQKSTFLREVHDLYAEYQSALGKGVPLVPAIIPGYNDRGVRLSERHPVIPRQYQPDGEEGSFFKEALNQTVLPFLNSEIPMALITSFNEWNEGTQIEPTRPTAVTRRDLSPSGTDYTQGYAYQGYSEKYLSILRGAFTAVSGRVQEEQGGKPLAGTEVKAFQGNELIAAAISDSQGFFNLSRLNLPAGLYEIKVHLPGYRESAHTIRVIPGDTAMIDFKLKRN